MVVKSRSDADRRRREMSCPMLKATRTQVILQNFCDEMMPMLFYDVNRAMRKTSIRKLYVQT